MARVLIVTLVFSPDGVSTATIVSEIADDLKKRHTLSVLTTYPHYNYDPVMRGRQPLKRCWKGLYHRSDYRGIPVWHTAILRRGEQTSGRALGHLLFNVFSLLLGIFAIGKQDVIWVVSPPLTSGMIGWILAKLKGAKLIYTVQELYPETYIRTGTLRRDSLVVRVLQRIEGFVYRFSDALTVICDAFGESIKEQGILPAQIHVIPNFVDTENIRPGKKDNLFSREFDLADQFIVLYAGNIGMTQSFDTLLASAKLVENYSGIVFLIIGNGVRRDSLKQQIEASGLDNVLMLPYQPSDRVCDIYASASIGLVPLMAGMAKTTLPSKIYTIMASGTPVLAAVDMDSDIAQLVRDAQAGIAVPPDDPEKLSEAILQGYEQQETFREYGENGRRYVEMHFSRQVVAEKYHVLIGGLVP